MVNQDTYALCRVFKKNAICAEVEELQEGQCSMALLEGACQQLLAAGSRTTGQDCYQTPSPDVPAGSTSGGADPDADDDDADKDDSWMQFISEDAWCSSTAAEESTSCVA